MNRRRAFITLLGGGAVVWPFTARAQQLEKLPIIAYLGSGTSVTQSPWVAVFVQRLHELGWIEGRTVTIQVRWAEGRSERAAEIAADFVGQKVNALVTMGTPTTLAAKQAAASIPIVFVNVSDPIASKLVASLARPAGNVTGISNQTGELAGKRLELLREIVPGLRQLAILVNVDNPAAMLEMGEVRAAARALGLDVAMLEIRRADDIAHVFEALKDRPSALYVQGDLLTIANRTAINTWALRLRLPTMHAFREDVQAGGLISYGASAPDLFRRAAEYVDKILRGARPADIPVEQPTKFDLAIKLTTAKVLGLTIPPTLLALATEVIE